MRLCAIPDCLRHTHITHTHTVPDGQAPSGPPDHPKSERVTTALSALALRRKDDGPPESERRWPLDADEPDGGSASTWPGVVGGTAPSLRRKELPDGVSEYTEWPSGSSSHAASSSLS